MEESQTTIKQVYNKYQPQDFNYFSEESTNLNPKREINLENLDRIVVKLQEVTDDIIRKRITPPEPEEEVEMANLGQDSPASGIPIPKQMLLAKTGGRGNAILFPIVNVGLSIGALDKSLEYLIGTFPIGRLLDELDKPPILDCEEILLQFTGKKARSDGSAEEDDNELTEDDENFFSETNEDDSGDDGDDGGGDEDNENEEENEEDTGDDEDPLDELSDDAAECFEINMNWLKIILIILKIIKILKMIIDLVLSIIVPILQILQWAIGAWLNPPNIALIIQFIIELVTALIVMIIAWVIQLIWNLLNLDCIADAIQKILAAIQEAFSAFASIASVFNPTHINLLLDKLNEEALDPLQSLIDQAKSKKEDWQKFRDEMKNLGANGKEMLDNAEKQLYEGLQSGISDIPAVATVRGIANQAKQVYNTVLDSMKAIESAFNASLIAENAKTTAQAMKDALKSKGKQTVEFLAMMASPFVDLEGST